MPASRDPADRHVVVVEAYAGLLEHLTDEAEVHAGAAGLGLPLEELAERLDCRVTLLDWSQWYEDEARPDAHARWMPFPATRPLAWTPPTPLDPFAGSAGIRRRPIPAHDPDRGRPFAQGLSPRAFGLLAESDPLFLASFVLEKHLAALHRDDPIDGLVLPMFGGPGYVAQMAQAAGASLQGVPTAVVVTGRSAERQSANGEGLWTRPAQTRRQMEDLSLRLADLAICFGPLGQARARQSGPAGPIVVAPRRLPAPLLEAIEAASDTASAAGPLRLRLEAPRQATSGALVLLDAVRAMERAGRPSAAPVACLGTDMTFGPNLPRDFRGYWSSRGWVKEMIAAGHWSWDPPPADGLPVRLHPSLWEHLPFVWSDLARGGAVLLSPEAAEGLAPGIRHPPLVRLDTDPTPATLASRLADLEAAGAAEVDAARRELCRRVVAAHRGEARARQLDATAAALQDLMSGPRPAPRLDRALLCLLDRRLDTREADSAAARQPARAEPSKDIGNVALTVAVACHEMGALVVETVESVWASSRRPDELLLIDDGSIGTETAQAIARLEQLAADRRLPLTVLRQENRGLSGARNRALEVARGSYISFLDGDDLIAPDFYRLALNTMRANPGLGGVAAWAETFGEGVRTGFWNAPQPELPLLLAENLVFVPVLWPTALLRELGGYDVRQRYNYEDWELPVRMLARGWPIATIPRYLQRYRVRPDSLLRTMSDVQNQVMRERMFETHRETVQRFGPELAATVEHRLMRSHDRLAEAGGGAVGARSALRVLVGHVRTGLGRSGRRWTARARGLVRRPGTIRRGDGA